MPHLFAFAFGHTQRFKRELSPTGGSPHDTYQFFYTFCMASAQTEWTRFEPHNRNRRLLKFGLQALYRMHIK